MNKINIKTTIIQIIVILLSFALIISNFSIDTKKQNTNIKNINGHNINDSDIKTVIQTFETYKKLKKSEKDLQRLIENNIANTINLKKLNFEITKKEILNEIINIKIFQKNNTFNRDLYNKYIKNNNITELDFQTQIKLMLEKNHIKQSFKLINNKQNTNIHKTKYIKIKSIKKIPKTTNTYTNNNIETFNIKYIDINLKNLKKHIILPKKKIQHIIKKNKFKYKKPNLIKINYININKKSNEYNNIKNKIKNNINININNTKSKTLWLTENEINKHSIKNLLNNEKTLIIKTSNGLHIINLLKKTTNKTHENKIIKPDIINNYKKFKTIKKIHKQKITLEKSLDLNFINNNYKNISINKHNTYGILSLKLIKPWFFKKRLSSNTNFDFIKINNNRYLILKLNKNKNIKENIQPIDYTASFFKKINIEKNIVKTLLKIKNTKHTEPINTKIKSYESKLIKKHTIKSPSKIIKYKNTYFIIN